MARHPAGRLTDYASFFLQVLWRVLTGPRHDYVVTLTTPPLSALVATIARMLKGQSYGIWSMDLHPDLYFLFERCVSNFCVEHEGA